MQMIIRYKHLRRHNEATTEGVKYKMQ